MLGFLKELQLVDNEKNGKVTVFVFFHDIIADEFRLLTFGRIRTDLQEHWKPYLAFGLFFTWLAGIGRYWDNPRALVWQHLGFGSVVYVFCLALSRHHCL